MGAAEKIKRVWASRREALQRRHHQGEQPDPTPVHIPGMHERPLSLRDEMRRFVREELSKQAGNLDAGTFEDEDDFSEDEGEPELTTPYTVTELTPEMVDQVKSDLDGEPTQEDLSSENQSLASADADADNPAPSPESPPVEAAQ